MESKGLNVKSFHSNQKLLDAINTLLIHFKLTSAAVESGIDDKVLMQSKINLVSFLSQLDSVVIKVEKREEDPLTGIDMRFREFAKSFVAAKGNKAKFKSSLFQTNIISILGMLNGDFMNNSPELIQSLTELRQLIEEQVAFDSKNIIREI